MIIINVHTHWVDRSLLFKYFFHMTIVFFWESTYKFFLTVYLYFYYILVFNILILKLRSNYLQYFLGCENFISTNIFLWYWISVGEFSFLWCYYYYLINWECCKLWGWVELLKVLSFIPMQVGWVFSMLIYPLYDGILSL